jgi:epoxyqueuosine reductase
MSGREDLTASVKDLAREAAFAAVGIAPAGPLPAEPADRLARWLREGRQAGMDYLRRNMDKRLDPRRLLRGARSVICLAASCGGETGDAEGSALIARYARGPDYHDVLMERCGALMDRLRSIEPAFRGRACVDTAPVMERTLAALAGLGWVGRNGCLIVPRLGSHVLLAEVVCNLPLVPDRPVEQQCGDCDACVRACPTRALLGGGLIDARLCISYWNQEPGRVPRDLWPQMGRWVLGCDICQEACPHNRGAAAGDPKLVSRGDRPWRAPGIAAILAWSEEDWDAATRGSAMRQVRRETFLRNALIAAGNSGDPALREPVARLRDETGELRDLADWALERLPAADRN